MSNNIFEPLQLSRGSHQPGSGKGCAMNVISWENGDQTITDYPACSDRMLARLVQSVNDSLAGPDGRLSPENSTIALDLGHATVGTTDHDLSAEELKVVYVRLAVHAARKVAHLNTDPRVEAALKAAEAWADNPSPDAADAADAAYAAAYVAYAAYAAAYVAAADAAYVAYAAARAAAAAYVAYAAARAAAADAAYVAARAAADAAYVTDAGGTEFKISLAWELIEMLKDLTGTQAREVPETVTAEAVQKMLQTA